MPPNATCPGRSANGHDLSFAFTMSSHLSVPKEKHTIPYNPIIPSTKSLKLSSQNYLQRRQIVGKPWKTESLMGLWTRAPATFPSIQWNIFGQSMAIPNPQAAWWNQRNPKIPWCLAFFLAGWISSLKKSIPGHIFSPRLPVTFTESRSPSSLRMAESTCFASACGILNKRTKRCSLLKVRANSHREEWWSWWPWWYSDTCSVMTSDWRKMMTIRLGMIRIVLMTIATMTMKYIHAYVTYITVHRITLPYFTVRYGTFHSRTFRYVTWHDMTWHCTTFYMYIYIYICIYIPREREREGEMDRYFRTVIFSESTFDVKYWNCWFSLNFCSPRLWTF